MKHTKKKRRRSKKNPELSVITRDGKVFLPPEEDIKLNLYEKYVENQIGDFFPSKKNASAKTLYISPTSNDLERIDALTKHAYSAVYKSKLPPPRFAFVITKIIYAKYVQARNKILGAARDVIIEREKEFGYRPIIRKVKRNPRKKRTTKKRSR